MYLKHFTPFILFHVEGWKDFQPRMKTLQWFRDMDVYLTFSVTLGYTIFRTICNNKKFNKYHNYCC